MARADRSKATQARSKAAVEKSKTVAEKRKKKNGKKESESGETTARKIWLAGLGAYGKSLEDAHEHIDKASQDASRFFHELVDKGQSIESQGREAIRGRISEARDKISGARERLSEATNGTRSVDDMIGRVRQRLGFGDDPVPGRLDVLTRQVNSLTRAVAELTRRRHGAKQSLHEDIGDDDAVVAEAPAAVARKAASRATKPKRKSAADASRRASSAAAGKKTPPKKRGVQAARGTTSGERDDAP